MTPYAITIAPTPNRNADRYAFDGAIRDTRSIAVRPTDSRRLSSPIADRSRIALAGTSRTLAMAVTPHWARRDEAPPL